MWTMLEDVYGRTFQLEVGTDNSTARLDILQGYSKGMKHLRRHQRVSISLFKETLDREDVDVLKLDTNENTTDVLTKPLGAEKHEKHRNGLGIG